MSIPSWLKLTIPVGLLAAAVAVALISPSSAPRKHPVARPSVPAHLASRRHATVSPATPLPPAAPPAVHPHPDAPHQLPTPRAVALEFVVGYLRYAYHHAPASAIPGMLPAFATALAREPGSSLPTPAELAARPRVLSLRLHYNCPLEAVGMVTYTDGQGARYELHPNLVREPDGWQVWSLPEATASIPLPRPLRGGTTLC